MEKFYEGLGWLDILQALDYLQLLIKAPHPIDEKGLLQLGRSRRLDVYVEIDPRGITGTVSDTKEQVSVNGIQLVLNPDMALEQGKDQTCAVLKHGNAHWIGLLPSWSQKALFKSDDIKSLAAKINNEPTPSSNVVLNELSQQLDDERANRSKLEAEVAKLKAREQVAMEIIKSAKEFQEVMQRDLKQAEAAKEAAEANTNKLQSELDQERAQALPSRLLAIAGLLELLLDDNRPRYKQGTAADRIEAKGWSGASASGLTKLFAEAKATAAEADKVAQAKAEAREAASNRAK